VSRLALLSSVDVTPVFIFFLLLNVELIPQLPAPLITESPLFAPVQVKKEAKVSKVRWITQPLY
jgi:hypothetical protein